MRSDGNLSIAQTMLRHVAEMSSEYGITSWLESSAPPSPIPTVGYLNIGRIVVNAHTFPNRLP